MCHLPHSALAPLLMAWNVVLFCFFLLHKVILIYDLIQQACSGTRYLCQLKMKTKNVRNQVILITDLLDDDSDKKI